MFHTHIRTYIRIHTYLLDECYFWGSGRERGRVRISCLSVVVFVFVVIIIVVGIAYEETKTIA